MYLENLYRYGIVTELKSVTGFPFVKILGSYLLVMHELAKKAHKQV